MNLDEKSAENMEFMIEEIKKKLKMAAAGAIKAGHFDLEQYEDIKDFYEVVSEKQRFSISEMEAIVTELGKLRKA